MSVTWSASEPIDVQDDYDILALSPASSTKLSPHGSSTKLSPANYRKASRDRNGLASRRARSFGVQSVDSVASKSEVAPSVDDENDIGSGPPSFSWRRAGSGGAKGGIHAMRNHSMRRSCDANASRSFLRCRSGDVPPPYVRFTGVPYLAWDEKQARPVSEILSDLSLGPVFRGRYLEDTAAIRSYAACGGIAELTHAFAVRKGTDFDDLIELIVLLCQVPTILSLWLELVGIEQFMGFISSAATPSFCILGKAHQEPLSQSLAAKILLVVLTVAEVAYEGLVHFLQSKPVIARQLGSFLYSCLAAKEPMDNDEYKSCSINLLSSVAVAGLLWEANKADSEHVRKVLQPSGESGLFETFMTVIISQSPSLKYREKSDLCHMAAALWLLDGRLRFGLEKVAGLKKKLLYLFQELLASPEVNTVPGKRSKIRLTLDFLEKAADQLLPSDLETARSTLLFQGAVRWRQFFCAPVEERCCQCSKVKKHKAPSYRVCGNCDLLVFCSEKCQKMCWSECHMKNCPKLRRLQALGKRSAARPAGK